jgi:DNA polymerase (family 10)
MNKHDLARIFNETGLLLELKGENPFKSRAYYNAARTLENLNQDLTILIKEGGLLAIPGFGDAIVKKITEWANNGKIEYYEKLKASIPPGLLDLLRIPGLGPKKINLIYNSLGLTTIPELQEACLENKLAALPGFGVKTQEKICAGIKFLEEHQGEYLLIEALADAIALRDALGKHPAVLKVELAGSIRRFKEIVHDIDLVVGTDEPQTVADFFKKLPTIDKVTSAGDTKVSVILRSGIAADLRLVKLLEYPHALQHFSGSKEHNTKLRHLAKEKGYKVNEYGLFKGEVNAEEVKYCDDEAGIYRMLGLDFIPPELREDLGEIEAAQKGDLPALIRPEDLRGIFHVHTTYSDGIATLRDMVIAATELGFSYIGISDHSQTAVYAHGLSVESLKKQWAEIDVLKLEFPDFKVFKGIEADILPSGELDYNNEILTQFDFVIGSVHSQFRMGRPEMTKRILMAMDNPFLTILGHPTGRILLERTGYELNMETIIAKAAEKRIAIEFNASPYRFDLDWRWCRKAKEKGVLIAVYPDAHGTDELNLVNGGIMVAQKGWLTVKDVLNTKKWAEVELFFKSRRMKSLY